MVGTRESDRGVSVICNTEGRVVQHGCPVVFLPFLLVFSFQPFLHETQHRHVPQRLLCHDNASNHVLNAPVGRALCCLLPPTRPPALPPSFLPFCLCILITMFTYKYINIFICLDGMQKKTTLVFQFSVQIS